MHGELLDNISTLRQHRQIVHWDHHIPATEYIMYFIVVIIHLELFVYGGIQMEAQLVMAMVEKDQIGQNQQVVIGALVNELLFSPRIVQSYAIHCPFY